jgi:hypothetical protein
VKKLLYLNGTQLALLSQQGVNLNTLTVDKLKDILVDSDFISICEATATMCSKFSFINRLGLELDLDWLQSICSSFYQKNTEPDIHGLTTPPAGTIFGANCTTDNVLLLYPMESEYINEYDMCKHSRLNVLSALTKIMIFKELKQLNIFKSAFIAEGK